MGLQLGLSIQSGWNLGGPNVTPDFAAKQVTFSEIQIEGPARFSQKLPEPASRNGYYRDISVLAYPTRKPQELDYAIGCSSFQEEFPVANAIDGDPGTFWVSVIAGSQLVGMGGETIDDSVIGAHKQLAAGHRKTVYVAIDSRFPGDLVRF